MSPQRSRHELPDEEIDDASSELFDLPAAVVCARCGRADCAGCDGDEPEAAPSASGVVLVVPWERPEQPLWSRFWATTRLGVDGAEVFFSSLPDGPVGPALSYAALAELVAVGACVLGFAALALGALGALVPVFTRSLLTEPWGQAVLGRVLTAAWGSFAALLVGVHALHGWALHRGASSPRSPLRRALRFGLYTAGLDVAGSPVGVLWLLSSSGRGAARNLGDLMFRAANRATLAMLRGFYQLDGAPAERLRRRATALSVAAVLVGLALCAAAIFAAALPAAAGEPASHAVGSSWLRERDLRCLTGSTDLPVPRSSRSPASAEPTRARKSLGLLGEVWIRRRGERGEGRKVAPAAAANRGCSPGDPAGYGAPSSGASAVGRRRSRRSS